MSTDDFYSALLEGSSRHPVNISVQNISLFLQNKHVLSRRVLNEVKLLDDISCEIAPGQLMALMGGSGSGKTTLLNVIAGKTSGSARMVGSVEFNGHSSEKIDVKSLSGYVVQSDFLLPNLTVRETLRFAALLRLPESMSEKKKFSKVESVITELGLKDCADTLVGNELSRGISGGEKRRVSIGVQLLTDPAILFLDEPTTGLDAFTAHNIIETLVKLARSGRVVLCSIHQPRSDIFDLFDQVLLLSKGKMVYSGPTSQMEPYFQQLGFTCPAQTNPADFYLDISSVDNRSEVEETASREQVKRLTDAFSRYRSYRLDGTTASNQEQEEKGKESGFDMHLFTKAVGKVLVSTKPEKEISVDGVISRSVSDNQEHQHHHEDVVSDIKKPQQLLPSSPSLSAPSPLPKARSAASLLGQTWILTRRGFLNIRRDKMSVIGNLTEAVVVSLFIGSVFYQLDGSQTQISARSALFYQVGGLQAYLVWIFHLHALTSELPIFDREREDGMYDVGPYVISKLLYAMPVNIVMPCIYSLVIYFMCGLRVTGDLGGFTYFVIFLVDNILVHMVALSLSLFCASAHRNFAQSSLIGNSVFTFMSLTSGFLVNVMTIPVYLSWVKKISFLWFSFQTLAVNELKDNYFGCEPIESPQCQPSNGNLIMQSLGVPDSMLGLLGLGVEFVVFQLVSYLLLTFLKNVPELAAQGNDGTAPGSTSSDTTTKTEKATDKLLPTSLSSPTQEIQTISSYTSIGMPNVGRLAPSITVDVVDLSLSIGTKSIWGASKVVPVLKGISAQFRPGQLSVIMGGSGSGKTTLLNVLTGRINPDSDRIDGNFVFNGHVPNEQELRSVVGYVMQNDYLLPSLTVRETFKYAALLRLPVGIPLPEKLRRVESVIQELGLKDCANTRIGSELARGISGGEKRRVSIGIQLLTDPSILLLDEPTSGLDSFTAHYITETLKNIALNKGRTVICTIHQPRSDVFKLFDHILLLSKGSVTYEGAAESMVSYFSSLAYQCPLRCNPADWMLDISSVDLRDPTAEMESRKRVAMLVENFQEYSEQRRMAADAAPDRLLHRSFASSECSATSDMLRQTHKFKRAILPLRFSFPVLFSRSWKNFVRQPLLMTARIMQAVSFGVILALFYTRLGTDASSIQNRMGVLFELTAVMFIGVLNNIAVFPAERNVFYRERADGAYSTISFFLSYTFQEIPFEIITAFLFAGCMAIIGLQCSATQFLILAYCVFCVVNCGESMGIVFCSLVYHPGFSITLTSIVFAFATILAGFMNAAMPVAYKILNYVSILKYTATVSSINELDGLVFDCTPAELQSGQCIYQNGNQILENYHFNPDDLYLYIGIIGLVTVAYRAIGFLVLKLNKRKFTQ